MLKRPGSEDFLQELFENLKLPPGPNENRVLDAETKKAVQSSLEKLFDSLDQHKTGYLDRKEFEYFLEKYLLLCRHLAQMQTLQYQESNQVSNREWILGNMTLRTDPAPLLDTYIGDLRSNANANSTSKNSVSVKVFNALNSSTNGRLSKQEFVTRVPV
ncbi:hypothetical protein RFI_06797, partial [Reticulomyxa filosa]